MLQLVAQSDDAWNWWNWDEMLDKMAERLGPIIQLLEQACDAQQRDPSHLGRTLDLYTVIPEATRPLMGGLPARSSPRPTGPSRSTR